MKKIVLTGGGTAGHVTPHFALLEGLKTHDIDITYIGSKHGMEKKLVEDIGLPYIGISSGKLRRYFAWKNFTDLFRIVIGTFEAIHQLGKVKPDVVFSKGGFVTVPVVIAARLRRIPVIVHESDMTPGLANKIAKGFATKICTTFEETLKYLPADKAIHTGTPIRSELLTGNKDRGYEFSGLNADKPIIMMMGGSQGSKVINDTLRKALPTILKTYQVIHLCGQGNTDHSFDNVTGYKQFEYINEELKDLFAITDMMLSRAGSNAINEFAYLGIPSLLIPLSKAASRGDQILNANAFEKKGFAHVIEEEALTMDTLIEGIDQLNALKDMMKKTLKSSTNTHGTENVIHVLLDILK